MKGLHAASFLMGAIAGGIIALLYAPQEGEKTRKQVRKFVDDGIDEAGEMVQRTKAKAKDAVNHGVEQVKNGVSQAREFVNSEIASVKSELCEGDTKKQQQQQHQTQQQQQH